MSILVSGSLAYDYIMNFPDSFKNHILPDQIHILNVCFVVDKLERSWGGTAGNIAYTLKLLGASPILISAIGRDGAEYEEYLRELGIDITHLVTDPNRLSASAHITTDVDDNQITAFYNGPLGGAAMVALTTLLAKPDLVLVSPTEKNVMIKHLREARELGIPAVFDPGQQIPAFTEIELKQMIGQANIVIGNDYEIKLIEERSGWSAKEIIAEGKTLVTTLGAKGSIISTSEGEIIEVAPCHPKSVDDPTGAGDAYRAGFCVGLERKLPLKTCGQIGSVAASYAIESYGTQAHKFTMEEFGERYEKTYGEKLVLDKNIS